MRDLVVEVHDLGALSMWTVLFTAVGVLNQFQLSTSSNLYRLLLSYCTSLAECSTIYIFILYALSRDRSYGQLAEFHGIGSIYRVVCAGSWWTCIASTGLLYV
jgi:hypothetical protein